MYVQRIWQALRRWFRYMLNLDVIITEQMVILLDYKEEYQALVNTVILLATQYVYVCKYKKITPNLLTLMWKINDLGKLERIIASRENRFFTFYAK